MSLPISLQQHSILGRQVWLLLPLCCAISALLFLLTGFNFVWSSAAKATAGAALAGLLYAVYSRYRPDAIVRAMAEALLFICLIGPPLGIMDYPLQALNFTLRDAEFAAIDRAMGFDWMAHFTWISAHPLIGSALVEIYKSCMIQMAGIIVLLSCTRRFAHLKEFLFLFVVTALAVSVVSTLLPAAGAFPYHAPPASLRIGDDPLVGIYHWADLQALRNGTLKTVDLNHASGLITLPSFHAIFAILLAWSMRGARWIFAAAVILNIAVCVSAISVGGHYLIDILCGALIAFVSIWMYQKAPVWKRSLDHLIPVEGPLIAAS